MEDDEWVSATRNLSLEERRQIAQWLNVKMPIPEMADRLGRPIHDLP